MIKTPNNCEIIELINQWLKCAESSSHKPYESFEQSFFDSDWEAEILGKH